MTYVLERVWATLVVLTLFAFSLGQLSHLDTIFVAILLISTIIKGLLIIDYFMDLKKVRLKYRLIPIIWLLLVMTLISIAYFLPPDNIT